MANVALVEKVPSKTDFIRHFDNDFQFDRFSLCSDKTKKKILKRDPNFHRTQYDSFPPDSV